MTYRQQTRDGEDIPEADQAAARRKRIVLAYIVVKVRVQVKNVREVASRRRGRRKTRELK